MLGPCLQHTPHEDTSSKVKILEELYLAYVSSRNTKSSPVKLTATNYAQTSKHLLYLAGGHDSSCTKFNTRKLTGSDQWHGSHKIMTLYYHRCQTMYTANIAIKSYGVFLINKVSPLSRKSLSRVSLKALVFNSVLKLTIPLLEYYDI